MYVPSVGLVTKLRSVLRFKPIEWRPSKRRLQTAANIEDLRRIARRRLPKGVFDYIDGGAEDEITLTWNAASFRDLEFKPRVLRDVTRVSTATEILGSPASLPLILSPTGFTRIAESHGELAVARAAERMGIPYTLSSLSTRSIEEVRHAAPWADLWFQVYVWKDKGLLSEMLERANEARYSTIVITVDTPVLGRRERDIKRGFTLPPKIGLGTIVDGIVHPGWTIDFLRGEPIRFANVAGKADRDGTDPVSLAEFINDQFDPSLSWADISWFRSRWPGKIVIKGIQGVEDAEISVEHGVDAIAVSNHGGRQLDGAPPPIELIEPIREAVGNRVEVYCDGGVRRGSDIVKAIALGADAAMVGRPYLYGLGAAGELGVEHALGLLADGFRRTLALTGSRTLDDVTPGLVSRRTLHTGSGSQLTSEYAARGGNG